ncbi:hypothetical protein EV424DRAFT_1397785 [Suillus variegatus]|nr:hypothetical protein EV424DRAFT_1397785 [Suillus variegatus]
MVHFVLAVSLLLTLGTGVSANCEVCPNCDYEQINIERGNGCLNYWTRSGDTFTCYYPSVANPETWNGCSYSASADWALTAGPTEICTAEAGVNPKYEPGNDLYDIGEQGYSASYGFVNETNSQLLQSEWVELKILEQHRLPLL